MNPSTGTFTSPDAYAGTIFDPVSLHKYLYANANPVMNRDPSGYYTLTEMQSAMAISGIIGGAINGTTKAVLGAIGYFREGGRFNMDFVGTFMSDFIWGAIDGAIIGGLFGAFGYLATQSLLASFLLRSFFGTMGVKSAWDFIQDLRRGDYGRAILDGLSAVLFFWGASQNYYRGGGLGNHGGNQGKNNPADDVADDAANATDDAAGASGNDKRYTPDQQAVIDLAKEAKANGGVTLDDTNTLLDWAYEYGVPAHGPEIHPSRTGEASNILHFHIGRTGHIPIKD